MFGRSDYHSLIDSSPANEDLDVRGRVREGVVARTARRTCGRFGQAVARRYAGVSPEGSASGGSKILKASSLLAALATAGLAVYFLAYRPAGPKPSSIEELGLSRRTSAASAPDSVGGGDVSGTTSPDAPRRLSVGVYVAGAVKAPGVYFFGEGRRVVDALDAAGGATAEADLDRLNLAAPLEDGIRIYVPKKGEESSPDPDAESSALADAKGFAGSSGKENSALRINVNRAPPSELEKLPGIGPALAQRMVEERTRNGPFRGLQDLRRVSGIGDAKIAQMAPFVVF